VTRADLRSVPGLWRIWSDVRATQQYYPLLHSAFWVEHRLWGDSTLGYHLANVLLHAASACLLVLLLRRLKVPGAELAGLVFAVHPVCVESVAWISEQKNTLSLVFYLLAALAYLRFDGERGQEDAPRAYILASLLFVLALLTKTVTATLPAALLVVFWWQRGRIARRDVLPLVPWFAVAAASGLFTAWVERKIGGAEGGAFDLTLLERCLLAGRVIWFYLGKLLWPFDLVFVYPRWDVKSAAPGWAGYLAVAVTVTAALWLLRRRSRGPLAAWLFYVGSLFPALGFVNVYPFLFSYVADHFQYLASIGIIAGFSAGAALLLERAAPAARGAGWGIAALLVATLVIMSNAQSATYADQRTLYVTTIERNPRCWMAHNNLGVWYKGRGEAAKAATEYREALRLRRDYPQAHNNLGVWLEDRGELDQAVLHFREAVRLKKDFAAAENNLGSALGKLPGRLDEAIGHFREALRIQPDFAAAHANLGTALMNTPGRLDEAIAHFEAAARLTPDDAQAHTNLGSALSNVPDRMDDAIAQYGEAIRLKPDLAEAHNNLGLALDAQGRTAEAVREYEEALRLKPAYAEIRLNIAAALLRMPGHESEAAAQLEALLQARPGNETARQVLAQIRANQP
ncbi:MAG TPA: tetratricopeptide repeat protein, partial [Opitutaceae bacterium]|nr:tetratricopeptide repeat protein [Opitutaceae bacterium]